MKTNFIARNKSWLIIIALVILSVGGGYYWYINNNKPVQELKSVSVERGDIFSTVSATGTIVPVNSVSISSKISGLIRSVLVNENDIVKTDQVLVILDDSKLRALVLQTKAKLDNATANFNRIQSLAAMGAVALQQLDSARMDYEVAKAVYDDSVSQLSDTVIKAPIDGMIVGKPIPAGQTVAPGISTPMVLMTVADMSKMQIETLVDESDIGLIVNGQSVNFTVDAYQGKVFKGVVSSISNKATTQQNVVYYTVIIDVADIGGLKPTMTARVTINTGEARNVLTLPLNAVKENKSGRYVQVMRDGKPQNINITTGLMNDEKVEIKSGLKENDVIVLQPQKKPQNQTNAQGMPPRNFMR